MLFNDLLQRENIAPADVLVLRHTPSEKDGDLRDHLPTLAAEHPQLFNAYQQTQNPRVEAEMLRAKYVASVIGLEEQRVVFIGLYKIGDHRPLTYKTFWEIPEYRQLKKYGLKGFVEGERPFVLWFDMTLEPFYEKWRGKLIIEWPGAAINYHRFANKAEFHIRPPPDSVIDRVMPPWNELVVSRDTFAGLPRKWREKLSQWRGVYLIFYPSDRKGYVGSAYGEENIYGRWAYHVRVGGDSVQLRKRKSENFEFSILEILGHNAALQEVVDRERHWKKLFRTYSPFGLNDN